MYSVQIATHRLNPNTLQIFKEKFIKIRNLKIVSFEDKDEGLEIKTIQEVQQEDEPFTAPELRMGQPYNHL